MTVNTTKITAGPYPGNGIADTVSFGFKIFDQEELTVYETDNTGVVTELMLGTDYTVQDLTDTGGTITRIAGPIPTGFTWFIRSNFIETQVTSFGSQGAFYPEIHENAFDKLTMLIQQTTDLNGRSPTMLQSYSGDLPIRLNDPVENYYLKWGADLTTIENVDAEGVMDQKDDVTLNAANQWAKNYTDQSVFDSGSVTPVTVNAGDEQLSGHVIFPTGTMYSAVVGDSIAVSATALRDGVNSVIYETSEPVTGVITDIDFDAGIATIGGVSVTLTAMNTIKDNTADIAANTADIAANTADIAANTADIAANIIQENYLKPNQNLNVPYGDAVLPNAVAEDYTAGDVFAYDYEAVTNIVGLTRTGGITSGTSGTYMRSYKGDFSSSFFGVQLADGVVSQTGVDIDYNVRKAGHTTVAVTLGVAPAHYCAVLSPASGRVSVINNEESATAVGGIGVNQSLKAYSHTTGVSKQNTTGRPITLMGTFNAVNNGSAARLSPDNLTYTTVATSDVTGLINFTVIIPAGWWVILSASVYHASEIS